ncbi:MAG: lysine--tRNA ligase [Phycisphaerales bacterium]|nr:lysine--tRNA ligase [Phycisphaerales bacterium]
MDREEQFKHERLAKADKLRAMGIDPYGGRFADVESAVAIRTRAGGLNLSPGVISEGDRARAAGRIVLLRDMGKLAFVTVRDGTGEIQIGLSKNAMSEQWDAVKLLDLGDIIGADGRLGVTKTGELTIWVDRLHVLCKALHPPPEKWHGLTDVELRYRHRYVDLFSNPPVRDVFRRRSTIVQAVRDYLIGCGYIEVETPALQPIYGGAAAKPFVTHHNTLDVDLFLRISPELYLKRLLVGGLDRVFEVSRNFRNEGISTRHNPEFTMVELYEAYADYEVMMERIEGMTALAIERLDGKMRRTVGDKELDFSTPWARHRYGDLLKKYADVDMDDADGVFQRAKQLGIYRTDKKNVDLFAQEAAKGSMIDHSVLVNDVFEATVEEHLVQPTIVYDYPAALCPLTRRSADRSDIALRFEAYVCGMELGNAYSELNDPTIQRANLGRGTMAGEQETMAVMDEDFLLSLEYGMPPAGGLGVGIDRLVMMLTDQPSIRDVILFPLQRPR